MNSEDPMDKPVTKRELLEVLDLWGNAFELRLEARLEAQLEAQLEAKLEEKLNVKFGEVYRALSAEFARHTDRIVDETRKMITLVDEKYNDVPSRLTALEVQAKAHEDLPDRVAALEANATPPPKRQRRR